LIGSTGKLKQAHLPGLTSNAPCFRLNRLITNQRLFDIALGVLGVLAVIPKMYKLSN
jgi:hypothetical protein